MCNLLAKDLLYSLMVKDQAPVKMLENPMLICSLFLLEFQWNNFISFYKKNYFI